MSRRRKIILVVIAFGLVFTAWWINRQLEPQRLTTLVLEKSGASLGLDLSFTGEPDYAFRPEPRLRIPALVVRDPASGQVILTATRADISLPWATITGGEPIITRIELDSPALNFPALRRWQASRPMTPFKLPTLLRGVHVNDGQIHDDGYQISNLKLDLPRLHTGESASAKVSGKFSDGDSTFDFDASTKVATPGLMSNFSLSGQGSLQHAPKPLAFRIILGGRYQSGDAGFSLAANSFTLDADSPLPRLQGTMQMLIAEPMQISFAGLLREWPKDWPTLPPPVSKQATDLVLRLSYRGSSKLSDPIILHLEKNTTVVDASLKLRDVQQWLAVPEGSPLPPLAATAKTATLDLDGMQLDGVEVDIHPDEAATKTP